VSDQPHASAASMLGKDPQHLRKRRPDGPQGWSDVLDGTLVILDYSIVFKVTYTRCCIDTTDSPDDKHGVD